MELGCGNWGAQKGTRIICSFAAMAILSSATNRAEMVPEIFTGPPIQILSHESVLRSGLLRTRRADVHPEILNELSRRSELGNLRFRFNLFADADYVIRLEPMSNPHDVAQVYSGEIEGLAKSRVLLARFGDSIAGTLFHPDHGSFQVARSPNGDYRIAELDPHFTPTCGVTGDSQSNALPLTSPILKAVSREKVPLPSKSRSRVEPGISAASAGVESDQSPVNHRVVELMVVYTAAARNGAGGTEAMNALIHLAVAEANTVFANSQTGVSFRLVHTAELSYEDSGDLELDIARLSAESDGMMNEVHTLRDLHKADLVSLLVENGRGQMGFAYLRPSPNFGFSILLRRYAAGYDLLAHELGHNFGCDHDRENGVGAPAFPYSYGHRFEAEGRLYRTIMSYAPGFKVPYFSNPSVLYGGVPTGIAEGNEGEADNARTIRETAAKIDKHRGISIVIASPQGGTIVSEHDGVEVVAAVQTDEGAVVKIEFFTGARKLGETFQEPHSILWTDLTAGRHSVYGRVTVEGGLEVDSLETTVIVTPSNDNFAQRTALFGSNLTARTILYAASGEPEEPLHFGSRIYSAWWTWIAPYTGAARLTTSGGGRNRPRIAVYQGDTLAALKLVAKTENASSDVHFGVIEGERYEFALNGDPELVPAVLHLTMNLPPPNDNFASATTVQPGTIRGTTIGAGREPNEPAIGFQPSGHSIWFRWIPTMSGRAELMFSSSNVSADLAVYTGSTLEDLELAATSAEAAAGFTVTSGTAYFIGVDGQYRDISLQLTHVPPPRNDAFAQRQFTGTSAAPLIYQNAGATREPNEPIHGPLPGGRSLWWAWRSLSDGLVRISHRPSHIASPALNVAVYTGSELTNLNQIAGYQFETRYPDGFLLPVEAGTTYIIAVDSAVSQSAQLLLELARRPSNDHFSNRSIYGTLPSAINATTFGATAEPGEPDHGGKPARHSVWWSRKFPANGLVAAAIESSGSVLPRLAVYKGASTNLEPVAHNVFGEVIGSDVAFHANANEEYHFVVDEDVSSFGFTLLIGYEQPPRNDHFAKPQHVLTSQQETVGWNIGASRQPGEPDHTGYGSGHSVWYSWTARSSTPVSILSSGYNGWSSSPFVGRIVVGSDAPLPSPFVAVYTGDSLESLKLVTSGIGDVQLNPIPQTRYRIAVDGVAGHYGMFSLRVAERPLNDDFARALRLGDPSAASVIMLASLRAASAEVNEPNHGGVSGGHSLWWTWTPANAGIYSVSVELTLIGSFRPPQTAIAVYTGSELSNLQPVISNSSREVTFAAAAGTRYFIALDLSEGSTLSGSLLQRLMLLRLGLQPTLVPPRKQTADLVQFRVLGSYGQRFILQTSPDLLNWAPLKQVTLQNTTEFRFVEPVHPGLQRLFYRVVPVP